MKAWRSWTGDTTLRLTQPDAGALAQAIMLCLDRDETREALSQDERAMLAAILALLPKDGR
jgi:hypothetical protein